jgi:hypothetical protein
VTKGRAPGRRAALAGAAAGLSLVAGGCGDGSTSAQGPAAEPPLPRFEADGTLPVEAFNGYLDEVDEAWETDAAAVATRFAHPVVQESEQVGATQGPGDDGETVAIVVVTGLADDSVSSRRTVVALAPDGDRWRIRRARWTQRCRTDRGHEDWSTEPCV